MNPTELNKIVAEYYKLHKQRKEIEKELDKLKPIILENFAIGISLTKDKLYQVGKTLVPSSIVEQYERKEYFKLEVNKIIAN